MAIGMRARGIRLFCSLPMAVLLSACNTTSGQEAASPDLDKAVAIAHATTTPEKKAQDLQEFLDGLSREGRLDVKFLIAADRRIGSYAAFPLALKRLPKDKVQGLLADCLTSSERMSDDERLRLASLLGDVGNDCHSEALFLQLRCKEAEAKCKEEDIAALTYKATLARAFSASQSKDVERLAVHWAKKYRESEKSQAEIGTLGRTLNLLLSMCGTETAYAQILENLKCATLTGDIIDGLSVLSKVKYAQAYEYAKGLAVDEQQECPVRVAAVRLMATMRTEKNRVEIVSAIDAIARSKGFVDIYQGELNALKQAQ